MNDETIKAIQTRIYQTLGFKLQFDAKKTAPTDEDKAWLESHKQFIPKDEKDDDEESYENIRNEFEKNAFKLVNHSEFATWKNDELIVQKKENFKIKYEELTFKEPSFDALTGKMVIKEVSFINKWFYDKDKRKYDTYDFIPPPLTCPDSVFNTWSGLQIEKTHSDVKPTDCQDLLDLIKVLSNHHDEAYEYILNWLAHIIQSPGKKCGTALVLKSKEGAGKNTLVDIMRMILGQFVAETANPQQDIFGTHGNIHIGKLLVCIDEVKSGDTSRCIGRLKNLITSNTCIHNPKGSHMVETQNHARFIFTTNESIPVSVDGNDRRYCLIECSNLHCKDGAFWDKFYEKLNKDKGMTLAFYQLLNTRDLSNVKWMQFPETELRKDMIATSAHPMVFWMDKFIRNEDFVLKDDNSYTAKTLHDHYNAYCVKKNMTPMSNSKAFGLIFKDKIDLDGCGIVKRKSHGVMVFDINKHKVFGWLQENELSNYEEVISGFVGVDEEDFF